MNNLRIESRPPAASFIVRFTTLVALTSVLCVAASRAQDSITPVGEMTGAAERITGRVVTEDGSPFVNAAVIIRPAGAGVSSGLPRMTSTNAAGDFEFGGLAPGAYVVWTFASGWYTPPEAGEPIERTQPVYRRTGERVRLTLARGGIITGTVRDRAGAPVVQARLKLARVRDATGRKLAASRPARDVQTDDRGVYRVWGLEPGAYVIAAGGATPYGFAHTPYDRDAPTYHPSATRDTAVEVFVRAGEEASGIDIAYRGTPGRRISGKVVTAKTVIADASRSPIPGGTSVQLIRKSGGEIEATATAEPGKANEPLTFEFDGVGSGEYLLRAQRFAPPNAAVSGAVSAALPIVVRDSDVTGIELTLADLGALAGRIALDSVAAEKTCATAEPVSPGGRAKLDTIVKDTIVLLRRDEQNPAETLAVVSSFEALPGTGGDFAFDNLPHGVYRLSARSLRDDLYVRAVTSGSGTATKNTNPKSVPARTVRTTARQVKTQQAETEPPATRTIVKRLEPDSSVRSISIANGQRSTNLVVHLAQGATRVSGKVRFADAEMPLPAGVRVHLVPVEAVRANDTLRYGETTLAADGTFRFANLAPGGYRLLAVADLNLDSPPASRPLAWDDDARRQLRLDAEARGTSVELVPCRSTPDVALDLRLDVRR